MRQSADSGRTADESPGRARPPRHPVAGQWRTGDGDELVDVDPARPRETVAIGPLAQERDLDQAVTAARDAFPAGRRLPITDTGRHRRRGTGRRRRPHINSETAGADPHVPFGGAKHSAYGPKERGRAAREFFTRTRTVYVRGSGGRQR